MLNREKYREEIIKLATNKGIFALKDGKPVLCEDVKCEDCDFCEKSIIACKGNTYHFREWLNSEYVEPPVDWSKVPVDTPILVRERGDKEWKKRYFAKYKDGKVFAWNDGTTSWSNGGCAYHWGFAKLAESEDENVHECD